MLYTNSVSSMMLPLQNFVLLLFSFVSNYCTIKFHGRIPWVRYLVFPITSLATLGFQLIYTPMASALCTVSMALHKRSPDQTRHISHLIRSCAPIKVRVSYFYFYRQSTVVKVIGTIISGTTRVLILTNKSLN